tara:strand:+ start:92 stop:301 length:210 start_codon:yes stop_codon:yes gene_type:complete
MKIKKELENVIERYYNNQFDLYKKMMMEDEEIKKKESDEEIKWSVMEFVMGEFDRILENVSEKREGDKI